MEQSWINTETACVIVCDYFICFSRKKKKKQYALASFCYSRTCLRWTEPDKLNVILHCDAGTNAPRCRGISICVARRDDVKLANPNPTAGSNQVLLGKTLIWCFGTTSAPAEESSVSVPLEQHVRGSWCRTRCSCVIKWSRIIHRITIHHNRRRSNSARLKRGAPPAETFKVKLRPYRVCSCMLSVHGTWMLQVCPTNQHSSVDSPAPFR